MKVCKLDLHSLSAFKLLQPSLRFSLTVVTPPVLLTEKEASSFQGKVKNKKQNRKYLRSSESFVICKFQVDNEKLILIESKNVSLFDAL